MEEKIFKEQRWKNKNKRYLYELQKFIDLVDNIEDVEVRKIIINQMIKCDRILTKVAEETFKKIVEEN